MSPLATTLLRPRFIITFCIMVVTLASIYPSPISRFSKSLSFNESSNFSSPDPTPDQPTRPNGVIFMLLPPSRVEQATLALRNVEDRFNRRLKYPYLLFMVEGEYQEVSEVQKERIEYITEGRAKFAEVPKSDWDVPGNLDPALVEASKTKIGFSLGYRSMCRWYSGFFWKHPALKSYDWLWRLDTDIVFHCDVPYDPIQRIIDHNALYGFVQVAYDADWVQPTLASNVSTFLATVHNSAHQDPGHDLRDQQLTFPKDANHGFVWYGKDGVAKALRGEAGNREWTGSCMYNNFEISHRSVWETDLYTRFFEFLDSTGGFFYERWGDSPVHSFGLAMSLRKDQAVQFKDLGYQHQGWEYDCPAKSSSCTCVKEKKFENFNDGGEAWYNPK